MRFKIFLDVQRIPQMYRMYLLSFIKEMIRKGDADLYAQLYDGKKNPKPFTFSFYMKDFHFEKESQQYVMKSATLIFSTSNPTVGVAFFNGLSQTDKFNHPEYPFKITSKEIGREQLIKSDVVTFAILNAVLLEDKNKKPILFTDPNFEQELNIITNKQFQALYGRALYEPLKVCAHKLKKQVIKETNRHADGQVLYYTAQKGDLILQGNPKDLQLIYQDGLGLRRSQGFGLLEVRNNG
ncbi:CRISPR-associated endoribonuclease Cas6 [Caryophanon latum]|uniref:CRISPR-associated endoribonuclease Cas6 n=1 Tax=Caryophanon latum TaxID=33977 RepID=A0A1C0YQA8_9BACL|nr:CRISPR-associated endoribonuclease Cas6 [Caryophanon latum]OCS89259.1 CRISPR-associated endoribonuclease Cas6 [Caryophanon latum]